jgi:hypothetical protein
MQKGTFIILSALVGAILYGAVFDWFSDPAPITLKEIAAAEQMCAPVGGIDHLGKKGGSTNLFVQSRLEGVCKDGTSLVLGPRE